ncbi:MAG: undecaprenyl-diphosphate phosphatase [Spirochaetes bacterium]|nr:undecaprenyl-diphosphate phosphatase [Spirochaetota bacterium]
MDIIKAIVISIVQGITEFLPISSSGHILLLKRLFNFEVSDNTFDIVIHFGTIIAVIIYFRKEIYELIKALFVEKINSALFEKVISRKDAIKLWICMIVANIPAVIVGIFFDEYLETIFGNLGHIVFLILSGLFFYTAILLFSTSVLRNKKNKDFFSISYFDAVIIGIFQAIAVLPGISRSGSTISAAAMMGVESKDAGRFSFLISIPLILGAFLFKVIKNLKIDNFTDNNNILIMIIGFTVSLITGYCALKALFSIIKKGKFWAFGVYMIIPIAVSLLIYFMKL